MVIGIYSLCYLDGLAFLDSSPPRKVDLVSTGEADKGVLSREGAVPGIAPADLRSNRVGPAFAFGGEPGAAVEEPPL